MTPSPIRSFVEKEASRFREELFEFLRIPSVSARREFDGEVQRAADWVGGRLKSLGFEVTVAPTKGHPVVLAERRDQPGGKTLVIYGHYDVQPAEPLELWTSPAFEPEVRDGRIYARGSVDDKGQVHAHLKAVETLIALHGKLPCNVVFVIEGEEEVGSEHLPRFLEENRAKLACDAVVISDSAMFAPGQPSILSSLRGLAYFEVTVTGPSQDLHSGMYGGGIMNPATALAQIIASFHDQNGRIAVAGVYDDVEDWGSDARKAIGELDFEDRTFLEDTGSPSTFGEAGYSTLERLWSRPTCEVNGMVSGYIGEGAKTVLPSRASAKVSFRLVPKQTPARIEACFRAHLAKVTPPGVTVELSLHHGGFPWRAVTSGPMYDAAALALEEAFGKRPVFVGEGGSIPIVGDFARILGVPVVLMGFGLPGENAHAPDEWILEENWLRGIEAMARFHERVAEH